MHSNGPLPQVVYTDASAQFLQPPLDSAKAHSDTSIEYYEYEPAKKSKNRSIANGKPLSMMMVLRKSP